MISFWIVRALLIVDQSTKAPDIQRLMDQVR